jgi:hypothetical protein
MLEPRHSMHTATRNNEIRNRHQEVSPDCRGTLEITLDEPPPIRFYEG